MTSRTQRNPIITRRTRPSPEATAMPLSPTSGPLLPRRTLLRASLSLLSLILLADALAAGDSALSFPGEKLDQWNGFTRHTFSCDGCTAWVVEPAKALPGNPWSWCMEFPDAFTARCAAPALLAKGFHHVHISVGNTFGCPAAIAHFDAFYALLIAKGLAHKAALIGISRGGLYAYRWAAGDPARVAVIYGDAPVCDFRSWPGGKGTGKGSAGDWAALQKLYGFASEAEALAYAGNPIDILPPLAKAGVALIHVVGDADEVVPPAENTLLIAERYHKLGGTIQVIHKPAVGHHPHGLDDPAPVVEFILAHDAVGTP
jgi:pimeloyl-ACP methyl ester carboxylesterase